MKNIHVLPTDKPSRLYEDVDSDLQLGYDFTIRQGMLQNQHIYITSDEEIKEGDWIFDIVTKKIEIAKFNHNDLKRDWKKIILTTDQDLITDGIEQISGLTDAGYKIIIPKEEPKQETLEEVALIYASKPRKFGTRMTFINGAKWQEQQTIEEVFEWLTTNNYLTDLKETLIENFKNK